MGNVKGITVELGMSTDKVQQKLRAIAKHAGALADELDRIDNAWSCSECGHDSYASLFDGPNIIHHACNKCGKHLDTNEELPTRLEGSE